MARGHKKTHEEFVAEVKSLVGEDYTVLDKYINRITKIKIKHNSCGHSYPIFPGNFLQGNRCPKCSKYKKKDTTTFKQEVYELAGDEYTVSGEYVNAKTKVEVIHQTCGEVYQVRPFQFLRGTRCPKCAVHVAAHSRRKTHTEFKKDFDLALGHNFKLVSKYFDTNTLIEAQCHFCKKIIKDSPSNIIRRKDCDCLREARYKEEVSSITHREYSLLIYTPSTQGKCLYKHNTCGHVFRMVNAEFNRGSRCSKCKESKGERKIREWLTSKQLEFNSQEPIRYEATKSPLFLDFYVGGTAIEFDGEQHFRPIEFFGGKRSFRETQRRDAIKTQYCADNGIPLIRIPYWDFDNIDAILTEKLLPLLDASSTEKQAS